MNVEHLSVLVGGASVIRLRYDVELLTTAARQTQDNNENAFESSFSDRPL